jgi:hypothetical protein
VASYIGHPDRKPVRYFIKYNPKEEGGNTDKLFLDKVISHMFNGLAMPGADPDLLERDMFNEYNERYLYVAVEEAEGSGKDTMPVRWRMVLNVILIEKVSFDRCNTRHSMAS